MTDVKTAGQSLGQSPEQLLSLTQNEIYAMPLDRQHEVQLAAVRARFNDLVHRIPVLQRLAEEQGISDIGSLDDLAPLLIPHSAMKSYPLSFLEDGRFDRLTSWLNGFTTHDMSVVDARGCDSIDDWVIHLDEHTPVRVLHSTGTSGKLSFLPRSTTEMPLMVDGYRRQFDVFGDERPLIAAAPEDAPIVWLQYRHGAMAQHRHLDWLQSDLFGGDAGMIATLYPGRFSADIASIGGRLRAAEARGELGQVRISPRLMERREQFIRDHENVSAYWDAFFDKLTMFKGRPVSVMGHTPMMFNVAVEAEKRNLRDIFAPGSFVPAGGGMKGFALPDDWRARVDAVFGQQGLVSGYGMTEIMAVTRACPQGHFHIPAWHVPFLLDPVTGKPFPRTGVRTGRYGAFDVTAQTYWAGFLTGDEVTLHWGEGDDGCGCGRIGPYVENSIRRYSEKEGGDDKITCAGAPDAHDKALDHILQGVA